MARRKKKTFQEDGPFFALPFAVLDHPDYQSLSHAAIHLLNITGRLCNGSNNGDICLTLSVLKPRGWTSKGTLETAIKELLKNDWIRLTRQGGRHKCSLYAISWKPIQNDCKGKLDIDWKQYVPRSLKKV